MKKFLPLIVFILVFSGFLVGQVGWQTLTAGVATKTDGQYAEYESIFLKGQYKTIDGKSIVNTKLKSPIVIYNFWASWCNPCIEEMPSLLEMKKKFKDDEVQVLAFNTDEDDQLKNIDKTLKKLNIKQEFNFCNSRDNYF